MCAVELMASDADGIGNRSALEVEISIRNITFARWQCRDAEQLHRGIDVDGDATAMTD